MKRTEDVESTSLLSFTEDGRYPVVQLESAIRNSVPSLSSTKSPYENLPAFLRACRRTSASALGSEFHGTKYIIIIRMKYRSDSDFAIEIALHSCKLLHHVPLIAAAIAITGTGGTKMRMKFKYKKIKSIRDKSISNRWRRGKNIQRGASLSISNHSR